MDPEDKKVILHFIKSLCQISNNLTLSQYKYWINFMFQIDLSISTFSNLFVYDLGYSIKKVNQTENILKFNIKNIIYTVDYLYFLSCSNQAKVKFLDEVNYFLLLIFRFILMGEEQKFVMKRT